MDRRELIKLGAGTVVTVIAASGSATPQSNSARPTERWGVFELEARGPSSGNPFVDVTFAARFTFGHRAVEVPGFYDGNGVYRVRFSPDTVGRWAYETLSSDKSLAAITGAFDCIPAQGANRGPVSPAHRFHFQHADGTPYFPFGTTCYSYGFVPEPYQSETLHNLKSARFNKVRMCLLPKGLGKLQPVGMPFELLPGATVNAPGNFNLTRLNPAYFQHAEHCIQDLLAADIQADVILFHPYDSWGFKAMGEEADDRYLRITPLRAFPRTGMSGGPSPTNSTSSAPNR